MSSIHLSLLLVSIIYQGSSDLTDELTYLQKFYNALNSGQSWSITWEFSDDSDKQFSFYQSLSDNIVWDLTTMSLTKMNLSSIGLVGSVPDGIDALSSLQQLILSKNQITSLPSLASNTKLTNLDVSYNSLSGYENSFPSSLTEVKLNNNSIKEDISVFLGKLTLSSLEALDLSDNKLFGSISSSSLLNTASLTTLNMAYNEISGSVPTIRDGAWEKLDLSYNEFDGDFPEALTQSDANANAKCNMFNCESLTNDATKYNIKECFCSTSGQEAVIESNAFKCSTCSDGTMASKWVRFSHWDEEVDDYTCDTPTTGCVNCMFPRNCVAGSCAEGSTGPTCETCQENYHMLAGKCEECIDSKVPIPALLLIVILVVIAGYGVFLSGLNILAATMIKQLFSFLQFYCLTMDIKANWPTYWGYLANLFKVSMINSEAFNLECITSMSTIDLFYIHWASAVVWPAVMTFIVLTIDKTYSARLESMEKKTDYRYKEFEIKQMKKKQTGTRRIWIMFILVAFVPMTALSLRMYACDSWSPVTVTVKYNDGNDIVWNQWFYDNSVSCYSTPLQGVNFLATMLLVAEFGIIVFLFLILFRLWRFDLKDKQSDLFGAFYESYNDKGLFCEPLLLLRKFILIMTTQLTYIAPEYSAGGNCALSIAWLLFVIIRQPYISSSDRGRLVSFLNNWCNLFEITATALIVVLQIYGLIAGVKPDLLENTDGLTYTMLSLNAILVIVWFIMFITVLIRVGKAGMKDRVQLSSVQRERSQPMMVVSNPVATSRVSPTEEGDEEKVENTA